MSTTQKLEYDGQLGGRITLPTHVSTYHYAAGALAEIKNLISEAQQTAGPGRSSKLIFQSLPKHMRRRAMSHHPKRLPRKYRKAHNSQMGKGGNHPVNHKRPSRKYRRRPGNLLKEYIRRQRKHIWLETHIWHAKRFHMVDRWGHRLPYASCDKTYRACYRASAQHCLLQDISYYRCVEIKANLDKLHQGFARLTSPECGPQITAKTYMSGRREGTVELFCDGQYPLGALQRASFIWKPQDEDNREDKLSLRTLWLWLHPSAAEATLEQILKVFELKSTKQMRVELEETTPDDQVQEESITKKKKKPIFKTVTRAFELQPHYANSTGDLQLIILQQEFNRFRLTGSMAQRVLASSLRPHPQPPHPQPHADYFKAALGLSSPSELLSNLIIGIQVIDPRLQKPKKRTKPDRGDTVSNSISSIDLLVTQPKSLAQTPLWQKELRQQLATNLLSPHAYDELRRKHAIVPGAPCPFEEKLQSVPLMLIQRPGSQDSQYKRLGYGSGWDVIAPAGYGMHLWLTLIMWGARPGGLREMDSVARESGAELHLPDTQAGLQEQQVAELERRTRYFRLPPNKRCNYRKLSVVSPFKPPWQQLVRDWTEDDTVVQPFYVCRQRSQLVALEQSLLHSRPSWSISDQQELPPSNSLIQVQIHLLRRGHLQDNALICLPTQEDYKHRWRQLKKSDLGPVHCEPLQPDVNEKQRKDLRVAHKRKLKRLRARRVREKRRCQETAIRKVFIRPANTGLLVRAQLEQMCRLWLPTDPAETQQSVRRQASRQVFGYVSKAGFSYTEAKVCAVGYVTANGLRELWLQGKDKAQAKNSSQLLCLVRDANSRDYRWASFKLNLNVATAPPF